MSSRFDLRPHQKRAIWRTIQQGDVYYAHAVGAGKTFTMIASGMEERRLGLVKNRCMLCLIICWRNLVKSFRALPNGQYHGG